MKLTQTDELGALLAVLKVRRCLASFLLKPPEQGPLRQSMASIRVLYFKSEEYNVPIQKYLILRTENNKACFSKCIKF